MKIIFLANTNDTSNIVRNPRGTAYYMAKYLEKYGAEIEMIPPAEINIFFDRVKHAFYKYVLQKEHRLCLYPSVVKREAKVRNEIVNNFDADFIMSFSSVASAFLETDKKITFWADACFSQMIDYYPHFFNITQSTIKNGNNIEQTGLDRAVAAFYSSDWARKAAITDYKVDTNKLFTAPYGANIEIEHDVDFIEKLANKRTQNKICKLLLVGVDWERKGADTAVAITKQLNELGLKSELMVIGCSPKDGNLPDCVNNIKFIDKRTESGLNEFFSYFKEANFYIMPTLAESFGHVFCEANAFGLPAISHKTGGIPDVITNGKNGQLFEIGENIDSWCNYIIDTFNNKAKYRELCLSSFNEYQTRLNWDVGAKIVYDKLKSLL